MEKILWLYSIYRNVYAEEEGCRNNQKVILVSITVVPNFAACFFSPFLSMPLDLQQQLQDNIDKLNTLLRSIMKKKNENWFSWWNKKVQRNGHLTNGPFSKLVQIDQLLKWQEWTWIDGSWSNNPININS